ncbi:MAG: hypothetical protein ACPHUE_02630 [Flavobacteriaceae bacterium]
MTARDYTDLLLNYDPNSEQQRKAFEKITYRFPYFQSAYAHYLKGLKEQEQYNFNLILRKTAVLSPSRENLQQWLDDVQGKNESSAVKKQLSRSTEKQAAKTEKRIDNPKSTPSPPEKKKVAKAKKTSPKPKVEVPLAMTYTDWVIYSSKGKLSKTQAPVSLDDKIALIDKFLENQPKIPPVRDDQPKVDLSSANAFNKEELMTETLAKVYLQQKKYKKALYAYKILSLKYPEKNSFFADQIKTIKQLQQNN